MFAIFAACTATPCPSGTLVDTFKLYDESLWSVCEDLQQPGGAVALVSAAGETHWFGKGHEVYGSANDEDYYLNLTKAAVVGAKADILAVKLLNSSLLTWQGVARAIPPIRHSGGVRAFVGSRGSSVDTTFSDEGEDAAGYGFPPVLSYVLNLSNMAEGGQPIHDGRQHVNYSAMAEGLVGNALPVVVFYYPVLPSSPYLPPGAKGGRRYWTMIAAASPDMRGSREQRVVFRFQQTECIINRQPSCALVGAPSYYDTFWWSNVPGGGFGGPTPPIDHGTPVVRPTAATFYAVLLENRRWWDAELAAEGMMELSLPSPRSTNGTWLAMQATHNLVLSMVTRNEKWGPRYGVLPGYGITMQDGFEDVFTSTAMAALEWGAMPYSKGLIDAQYRHYIRDDGLINYRAEELAQQARMLTILALYHGYSGGDAPFLLAHFDKAKALA
eukprot:336583-Prymnesium_polylepis.1